MSILNKHRLQFISSLFFILLYSGSVFSADISLGKEKSVLCMGCHGAQGISISPDIPNLAGQKDAYLVTTLKDFRAEVRKNPIMNSMVKTLTDADIENLAAYFSSLK